MKRREVWVCMYLQMKVWRMDTSNVLDFLPIFWVMTLTALFLCFLWSDTELSYKQILSINGNKQHRAYWLHTVLTGYVLTPVCSLTAEKNLRYTCQRLSLPSFWKRDVYAHERGENTLCSLLACSFILYLL